MSTTKYVKLIFILIVGKIFALVQKCIYIVKLWVKSYFKSKNLLFNSIMLPYSNKEYDSGVKS